MKLFVKKRLQIVIAMFLASALSFVQPSYADSDSGTILDGGMFGTASIIAIGAGVPALIALLVKRSSSPTASTSAAELKSIMVTPVSSTVALGRTPQFTATGIYSDSSTADLTKRVTWSSSNPSIASIDNTGVATTTAFGSTDIQATISGLTDKTSLTVVEGGPVILSVSNHNLASYNDGINVTPVTGTITVVNYSNTSQKITLASDNICPIEITDNNCSSVPSGESCKFTVKYPADTTKCPTSSSLPTQTTPPPTKSVNFRVQDSSGGHDAITINAVDITFGKKITDSNPQANSFYDPSVYDTNAKGLPHAPNTIVGFNKNGYDFLYASFNNLNSYNNGIFRSSDNGVTWSPVGNGLTSSSLGVTSLSVIKDASSNYPILCASTITNSETNTSSGVYISADGGETWRQNSELAGKNINTLYYSSNGVLYAAGERVIYQSADRGNTWVQIDGGKLNEFTYITALCATPDPNNNLYNIVCATDYDGSIYKGTTSDGTNWNWVTINSIDDEAYIYSIYIDAKGSYLYVGTAMGIYRSKDLGNSWQQVNDSKGNYYVQDFTSIGNSLYAGTIGLNPTGTVYNIGGTGVLVSSDSGNTWKPLNSGLMTPYTNIYALNAINGNLYIGTDIGFFTRNISSSSWVQQSAMLAMQVIQSLSAIGNNLFAGLGAGFGVFMSSDGGANWTAVNSGLTNTYINTLYQVEDNLYAGTSGSGVFMGTLNFDNSSVSWNAYGLAGQKVLTLYSYSTNNGTNLCAGTDGANSSAKVSMRVIGGESWNPVGTGLSNQVMALCSDSSGNLYAGTYTGSGEGRVFSINPANLGGNWLPVGALNQDITSLYLAGTNFLYAGYANYFGNTTKGGISYIDISQAEPSWTPISSSSSIDVQSLYSVSGGLYAAITAYGFYPGVVYAELAATPSSTVWTQIFDGTSYTNRLSAYVLSAIDNNLYVGTNYGVLKSSTISSLP